MRPSSGHHPWIYKFSLEGRRGYRGYTTGGGVWTYKFGGLTRQRPTFASARLRSRRPRAKLNELYSPLLILRSRSSTPATRPRVRAARPVHWPLAAPLSRARQLSDYPPELCLTRCSRSNHSATRRQRKSEGGSDRYDLLPARL